MLRSKLSNVEIGFKEDDAVYLVCPYGALADMLQKYLDTIAAELEQAYGKSFTLQTIEKAAYERWREANYTASKQLAQVTTRNGRVLCQNISRKQKWSHKKTCEKTGFYTTIEPIRNKGYLQEVRKRWQKADFPVWAA